MSESRIAPGPPTLVCIQVWRFHDAPKEYADLSTNGGDEDWLALVPSGLEDDYISWLEPGSPFGWCSVDKYEVPGVGWVYIGSHA